MFVAGILILVIASLIRVWAALQHRRSPEWRAGLYSLCGARYGGCVFGIVSTILGILGAVLIGISKGFVAGIISFALFWVLPYFW